jgi:ribosomal protein S18 acetylase RimI-like enzyme
VRHRTAEQDESKEPPRQTPVIRPVRGDEISTVLALWRAEAIASATDTEDAVRQLCSVDPGALIVAAENGQLVGAVIAAWDGWRGNLYRLAVRSRHRRRGIARALVRAAVEHLQDKGANRISGLVFETDDALALAEAVGGECDHRVVRFVKTLRRE